jgi:polysaccharide pyruvyl transferase WcaK-like protein
MKIGILTFHYTSNQGSVLQAYCTFNLIKKYFPDADVEIINLIPATREFYEIIFLKREFPLINISKFRKYKQLRKFVANNLKLSSFSYSDSLKNQIDFINNLNYDYIITGSDTVWFHSKKLKDRIPSIYFLPKQIKAKKIAFAASVDPLNAPQVYYKNKKELKEIFDSFLSITNRDSTTFNLLNELDVKDHTLITDPTLIYNFEEQLKFEKVKEEKLSDQKRIGIGIADRALSKYLIDYLKKTGFENIHNFFDSQKRQYDYVYDELNKYSKLDILITDRFHRTIFSLKLSNALTIYIENPRFNVTNNSKGRDLLKRIGLEKYVITYANDHYIELEVKIKTLLENWTVDALKERNVLLSQFIEKNRKIFNTNIIDKIV